MPVARFDLRLCALGCALLVLGTSLGFPTGENHPSKPNAGERLYTAQCAPCHGLSGRGGPGYRAPLTGTLSVSDLAQFIGKSMPPGPKKCPMPQAKQIAAYAYETFYSPIAQERNRPARVELSRLTVRQFKNAMSDLVSGFHPAVPGDSVHGLQADYFKGRSREPADKAFGRIDPNVDFDFGVAAPSDKEIDPHNFAIVWSGSVLAPDSGDYEFCIHSRHACQLWINGSRYPTADGEVRSAGDADPSGTVTLLGGRAYSLYMVFTKATQGITNENRAKTRPTPAYVTLEWQRPSHSLEPIPTQFLFPEWVSKTFVPTTHFPPDDRSMGYERGNSVSKDWDDATTAAALEAATYVSKNLEEVTGVGDRAKDREGALKAFCKRFLDRAFRRPISEDVERVYIEKQFKVAPSLEAAVERVVFLGMKSPRFLYREISPFGKDQFFIASQLSFGLWDTIPDPELEEAARNNQLGTQAQIIAQAERMTLDNRAWSKLRQFLLLWLKVDEVPDLVKSPTSYPTFDSATASDLRTSFELFLQDSAWGQKSDFRDLMTNDQLFLNGRLAKLYGADLPSGAPFQKVALDSHERAGIITNPYLLARFAYYDGSSPIHRGVLIVRNLLGRTLSPPPSNFTPLAAGLHPDLTTRQRVALQTQPAFCNNCHGIINPLGFTLEKFDAIGKFRETDRGKPVDSSGSYRARNGTLIKFGGARDLARYLAESEDSRSAFVEKLFLNVAKQPPLAYGNQNLKDLEDSFVKNQYSIRSLLVNMVVATATVNHPLLNHPIGKE